MGTVLGKLAWTVPIHMGIIFIFTQLRKLQQRCLNNVPTFIASNKWQNQAWLPGPFDSYLNQAWMIVAEPTRYKLRGTDSDKRRGYS